MAFTGSGNYEVKAATLACTIRARGGYVLLGDFRRLRDQNVQLSSTERIRHTKKCYVKQILQRNEGGSR